MDDRSDNEIMSEYVEGDETAFQILFERYSVRLNNFLRYRLGSKRIHLSEEIYQKTWLKIHVTRNSYNALQSFSTWFFTIAINTLRDEIGSAFERTSRNEMPEQVFDTNPNSEALYLSKEEFRQVESFFKYLTENQKTALLLSDQEEMTSKEIAAAMKVSHSTARQLVSRARKIIRSHYQGLEKP